MWKKGLRSVEERTEECGREDCGVLKRRLRSLEKRTVECGREDCGGV